TEGLLDHAEGAVQRERPAALVGNEVRSGLVRGRRLRARSLLVAASPPSAPPAPAPAAAFAALATPIRSIGRGGRGPNCRLGRGAGHVPAEGDLVLAVVEPGGGGDGLVGG